ncbi:MAG: hypothetical protein AAF333_10110 [Planctomycetota bacterium]
MNPRFITKNIHALLDYPVAIAFLTLPFLLGLGSSHSFALWLGVGTGAAALVLTLLTNHKLGVFRILPYPFHLLVDGLVGAAFLIAPFALGFSGLDAWFYWINGVTVAIVVGLHQPEPLAQGSAPRQPGIA